MQRHRKGSRCLKFHLKDLRADIFCFCVFGLEWSGRLLWCGGAGRKFYLIKIHGRIQLLFAVIKQRFFQLGAGWLCSLTVYSFWLFGIFTCFWSFCLGMGIASFTAEKGFLGLPIFLRSVLPQGIFYLVVWYVLSCWSVSRQKRLRLPAVIFLMLLTVCGAAVEAYFY